MRDKKYWTNKLGEEWAVALKPLLKSPYMDKLMDFVEIQYALNTIHPKDFSSIFNAFKYCPYKDLKVVIIGEEPSFVTGLGSLSFSSNELIQNPSASQIRNCVEKVNSYLNLDFDFTFESWARQGVLMINRSLTCLENAPKSHKKQWKKFFGAVLYLIVTENPGTIFFLWGKEAQQYSEVLSFNQHVFSWEHPYTAFLEYRDWECPNFKQADELIKRLYNETITW